MLAFLIWGIRERGTDVKQALIDFFKDKAFLGLTLVFLVYFVSGLNSEDHTEWIKQVRIKAPFLVLPLAFYFLNAINRSEHKWIHLWLGVVGVVSAVPVLFNFFNNQESLIRAIGQGHSIPTPIDHIHYSIILAYAALSLLLMVIDRRVSGGWEKWLAISLSIALAAVLHVLAVRSGIAILYLGLLYIVIWYVIKSKRYIIGAVTMAIIVITPIVMYHTIPSLKKKISYMRYDIEQYQAGKGKNYSDSERLMSYEISYELTKESPWVGHGVGDLKPLMVTKHTKKYGEKEKYIFPHNQYLYVLATVGIFGFLFFFYGLLSPLIYSARNPYLDLIFLTMLASFMVENTVQRAVSIGFFLFFILINMKVGTGDREKSIGV